jgi:hypothetical protein
VFVDYIIYLVYLGVATWLFKVAAGAQSHSFVCGLDLVYSLQS